MEFLISPEEPESADLNALYRASWPSHDEADFSGVLSRSLAYVCAYRDGVLVGFVYVAWDGWQHAFLLDTTVHPDERRRGVGTELVRRATSARENGAEWLHVDFEPHLERFYRGCGFRPTGAGLIRLDS